MSAQPSPSPKPFRLVPGEIPEDGLHLEGEAPEDIFALEESNVRAVPPLRYRLFARVDDGLLIVTGTLECDFELVCGRCLERFRHRVSIPDFAAEFPVKNEPVFDLTEPIREDILLALPGYPRCDASSTDPRTCPAAGLFEGPSDGDQSPADAGDASPSRGSVWDALDKLRSNDPS